MAHWWDSAMPGPSHHASSIPPLSKCNGFHSLGVRRAVGGGRKGSADGL